MVSYTNTNGSDVGKSVTVKLTGTLNGRSVTVSKAISLTTPTLSIATGSTLPIEVRESIDLSVELNNSGILKRNAFDYTWSTGDNGFDATFSANKPGTYTVTVTGVSTTQPSFTIQGSIAIEVVKTITVDAGSDMDSLINTDVVLSATTNCEGGGYSWSGAGIVGATDGSSITVNHSEPGEQTYTVTYDFGEQVVTDTVTVNFTNKNLTVNAGGNKDALIDTNVVLSASTNCAGGTYSWSGAGIVGSTDGSSITVRQGTAGEQTYTVSYTFGGETVTDTVTVNFIKDLTIDAVADKRVSLINNNVVLSTTTNCAGGTYSWSGAGIDGSANSSSITVNHSEPGEQTYTVSYTLNNQTVMKTVTIILVEIEEEDISDAIIIAREEQVKLPIRVNSGGALLNALVRFDASSVGSNNPIVSFLDANGIVTIHNTIQEIGLANSIDSITGDIIVSIEGIDIPFIRNITVNLVKKIRSVFTSTQFLEGFAIRVAAESVRESVRFDLGSNLALNDTQKDQIATDAEEEMELNLGSENLNFIYEEDGLIKERITQENFSATLQVTNPFLGLEYTTSTDGATFSNFNSNLGLILNDDIISATSGGISLNDRINIKIIISGNSVNGFEYSGFVDMKYCLTNSRTNLFIFLGIRHQF